MSNIGQEIASGLNEFSSLLGIDRPLRVIVCGGRDFTDRRFVFDSLDRIDKTFPIGLVIHGAQRGPDRISGEWAKERGRKWREFPADWKKYDKQAGPVRNRKMIEHGADFVIAFPGGIGTANMMRQASEAGLIVMRAVVQPSLVEGETP